MTFSVALTRISNTTAKIFCLLSLGAGLELGLNACTKEVVSKVDANSAGSSNDLLPNVPLFANSYQVSEMPPMDASDEPKNFLNIGNNVYFTADGGDNNQQVYRYSPNGGGLSALTTDFSVDSNNARLYALGSQVYLLNNSILYKLNGSTFSAVPETASLNSMKVVSVNPTSFILGSRHYSNDEPTCMWGSLFVYSFNGATLTALKDSSGKNLCLSSYQAGFGFSYPTEDHFGNNISNVASVTAFGPFNDNNTGSAHDSFVGLWDNNTMTLFKTDANPYPYDPNYYRVAVASDKSKIFLCASDGSGKARLFQLRPNDFTELTSLPFDAGFLNVPLCRSLRPFKDGFALQNNNKIVSVTGATPVITTVSANAQQGFEVLNDEIVYLSSGNLYRYNGSSSATISSGLLVNYNNFIFMGSDGAVWIGLSQGSSLLAKWDGSTLSYFPVPSGIPDGAYRNQITPVLMNSGKVLIYTTGSEAPYYRIFVSDGTTTSFVSAIPDGLKGYNSFALGSNLAYAAGITNKGSKMFGFNTLTPSTPSRQIFSTNNDIGRYNSQIRLMARSGNDLVILDNNDKVHFRDKIIDMPQNYNEYYTFKDELYVDIDGALLKFVDGDFQILKDFGSVSRTVVNDFWITNEYDDYRISENAVVYYLETKTRSLFTGKTTRQVSLQQFDGKTWTSIELPYSVDDGSYYDFYYANKSANGLWAIFDYYDSTGKRSSEAHFWDGQSLKKSTYSLPEGASLRYAWSAGNSEFITYRISNAYHIMELKPDLTSADVTSSLGNVTYVSGLEQGSNNNSLLFDYRQTLSDGSTKYDNYAYANGFQSIRPLPDSSAPFSSVNEIAVQFSGNVIAALNNDDNGGSQLFFWSKEKNWYSGSSSCRVAATGDDWISGFASVSDITLFNQSNSELANNGTDVFLTNGSDCRKLGEFNLENGYYPLQIGDSFYFIASHNQAADENHWHFNRIYKATAKK